MKSLLALLTVGLLSMGATSCGGSSDGRTTPMIAISTSSVTTASSAPVTTGATTTSGHDYLNDGDAEKVNDGDADNQRANHEDGDADSFDEYETTHDNNSYHDQDDKMILTYGHAATATEKEAVVAAVERYYAAAAVGDGARGCSTIASSLANAVPEDYGQRAGPTYLRGGKTCQAVLSLLFKHFRSRLAGTVHVTGVRVAADHALALLGSRTMPASYLYLERMGGAWKVDGLLGEALP